MGQIPTCPPDFVEKIDAIEAIKKYQPEVVIGAWITENNPNKSSEGNIYGPSDFKILQAVGEYIHIGCHKQHGKRESLARPHETFEFPWILSRTSDPVDDVIHCWQGDKA
jgi:hypothetical protein